MSIPIIAYGRELIQAIDHEGQHHLLIPADLTHLPENTRSPLSISFGEYRFGAGGIGEVKGRYLDIHCRIPALNPQFDKVIGEIIGVVEDAKNPIGAAVSALATWRRLFSTLADARPLTYKQKLSAFGELSVLQELIEMDPAFRADSWVGPERRPHDFELPDVSVEVKSVGAESDTIRVHGLLQLALVEDKELYLVVRRVGEDADGQTVPELLSQILVTCDDPTLVRERAGQLGVYEAMEDSTRFRVNESLIGRVSGDFPRITVDTLGTELASKVARVNYDLRLADIRWMLIPGSVDVILEGGS